MTMRFIISCYFRRDVSLRSPTMNRSRSRRLRAECRGSARSAAASQRQAKSRGALRSRPQAVLPGRLQGRRRKARRPPSPPTQPRPATSCCLAKAYRHPDQADKATAVARRDPQVQPRPRRGRHRAGRAALAAKAARPRDRRARAAAQVQARLPAVSPAWARPTTRRSSSTRPATTSKKRSSSTRQSAERPLPAWQHLSRPEAIRQGRPGLRASGAASACRAAPITSSWPASTTTCTATWAR